MTGFMQTNGMILLLLITNTIISGSAGVVCGRYERLIEGQCQRCPKCKPGFGLNQECGYGDGAGAVCKPCPPNTYNPYPGGSTCKNCIECSQFSRQVAYQCRPVINAECGDCLPRYLDVNADAFDSMMYPCEPCHPESTHPNCSGQGAAPAGHDADPHVQIISPVTTGLQANARPVRSGVVTINRSSRTGIVAVTLGVLCVASLIVIMLLLVRQRKLTRRLLHWRSGEGLANPTGTQEGSRSPLICQPFQQAERELNSSQVDPLLHTNPFKNDLINQDLPNIDIKRKREFPADDSSCEDCTCETDDDQDVLETYPKSTHVLRKRPRVNLETEIVDSVDSVDDRREGWGQNNPFTSSKITLRLRNELTEQSPVKLKENMAKAHCPHSARPHNYTTEDREEEEDEDDGPIMEVSMSASDDDTASGDQQHLGACAMPLDGNISNNSCKNPTWPYVDFSNYSSDLSLNDLHLKNDSDEQNSQESSDNLSQASTLLIRGQVPISSSAADDTRDGFLAENLSQESFGDDEGDHGNGIGDDFSNFPTIVELPMLEEPSPSIQQPVLSSMPNQSVSNEFVASDEDMVDDQEAEYPVSGSTVGPPRFMAPAPRSMASLSDRFTSSRGDLAESAEAETQGVPQMQKTLDEERYAQSLHLAKDHLVTDLDFDICEKLAAALLPKRIPGDRNFYHLGAALGIPCNIMDNVTVFEDVLVHLRRRRVLIITLLKALRALNRMDALYGLSVWVLENYAPTSSPTVSIQNVPQPSVPLSVPQVPIREPVLIPESQNPLEGQSHYAGTGTPPDATPIQETGHGGME